MRDYLTIASAPVDEPCAQVGSDNYDQQSRKECRVFKNQLRRLFGPEPEGAVLKIKSFPHDFGSYREVVCEFDDNYPESVEYAFKLEAETPENWDEQAKEELEHDPKLTFDQWMRKVDAHVAGTIGLGASDLPDMPYRDWYDSGTRPQDAAKEVIEENMGELGLLF